MRNFTLLLLSVCLLSLVTQKANAQCPNGVGMQATPMMLAGHCYFFVQHAIPNSNVSIHSSSGFVAAKTADALGVVVIEYPCGSGPITAVVSLLPGGGICSSVNIAAAVGLPVKLRAFTGEVSANGALLKWTSSLELNNSKYVIEKSTDGRVYQSVGDVAGAGNSGEDKHYTFVDASFRAGDVAYYRLKQVDVDGKSTYSKIVYVNDSRSGSVKVRVSPNPFVSEVQLIGINASNLNRNNIRLQNMAGAPVKFEFSGSNGIKIDPALPTGLYILTIEGAAYKIFKN